MKNVDYEDKKAREKDWYEKPHAGRPTLASRVMHCRLIFEPNRNRFNYDFPRRQMAEVLARHTAGEKEDRLLIAPCGMGVDYRYVSGFAREVHGIDLSPIAISHCPEGLVAKVGDILESGYPDGYFDVIVSPLIFHHMLKIGFDPFLKEFSRLLRKGGRLVILEPSIYYPLNIITRPLKRILGNPFDEIEEEDPFRPAMMSGALRRTGYVNIEQQAASFSHCAFYIPLARAVNYLTKPFLGLWPFKHFGWMVVFFAENP